MLIEVLEGLKLCKSQALVGSGQVWQTLTHSLVFLKKSFQGPSSLYFCQEFEGFMMFPSTSKPDLTGQFLHLKHFEKQKASGSSTHSAQISPNLCQREKKISLRSDLSTCNEMPADK